MSEYVDFHYMPLEGKITGKQVLKQTEDAINDLGQHVYEIDIDNEKIQEAIDTSNQAIETAEAALSAVTTNRAMWFNTVAEMKATDIALGITVATRGKGVFNDGDGAFYAVREIKGGDVDSDDTVFLNNGNVAERIKQFNLVAKGNNIVYVANVADLRTSDAVAGLVYGTTGYYAPNDGGAGLYSIRTASSDVDNGGSIIILDNGNVAELITDGTANVRQYGAKGDGTTDDTSAFQNMFAGNKYQRYRIPKGNYSVGKQICNYTGDTALTKNVEIFGDGYNLTKLKLRDNVITADNQRLITLRNKASYTVSVSVHDFYVDMNRTNNHALVDSSGDPYALQHCHAVGIESLSVSAINVLSYNLEFYDLIADGVGMAGDTNKSFDTVMVRNIISKGRQGTRSDVCMTGDYNTFIISDCDLDSCEVEVNRYTDGNKRFCLMSNIRTRQRFDIGAKNDVTDGVPCTYRVVNSCCFGVGEFRYATVTFDNCVVRPTTQIRVANSHVTYNNCDISAPNVVFGSNDNGLYGIYGSGSDKSSIRFIKCSIDYSNDSKFFVYKEGQATDPDKYCVVFEDCEISSSNTTKNFVYLRSGYVYLKGNKIKLNNVHFVFFGSLLSEVKVYSEGNTISGTGIITYMPTDGLSATKQFTLWSHNNKTDVLGNTINFYNFTTYFPSNRGGSNANLILAQADNYESNATPSTGEWAKGQIIYNTNPSAGGNVGWICTASGSPGTWKSFGTIEA